MLMALEKRKGNSDEVQTDTQCSALAQMGPSEMVMPYKAQTTDHVTAAPNPLLSATSFHDLTRREPVEAREARYGRKTLDRVIAQFRQPAGKA
jgi:hypothetical protein